jgi:hypothetical protein
MNAPSSMDQWLWLLCALQEQPLRFLGGYAELLQLPRVTLLEGFSGDTCRAPWPDSTRTNTRAFGRWNDFGGAPWLQ